MSNSDLNSIGEYKKHIKEMEMILDNIPVLVFYKDDKNNLIRVNKYFADAHETTKKNLAGKNCFDIYPKDVAQKYLDDDLEVIKSKTPKLDFVEPWDVAEGRKWFSTSKIPLFNDEGEYTGIISISRDVSEQVKAEEKLKKAQEQLNTIFSNVKDTVFVISEDYKILFKNDSALDLFGEELIGKKCYETIKGLGQPCERCPIKTFLEKDVCQYRFEQSISSPIIEGTKYFDIISTPIENYDGQPAIVEVLRDITENRKLREELKKHRDNLKELIEERTLELQKSEEKYRLLVENTNTAITLFDDNGTYLFLNNIALQWINGMGYNLEREDIVDKKKLHDTFPKDVADFLLERFHNIIKSGVGETIEERIEDFNQWISLNCQPVRDQEGKIIGIQIITQDITDRKKAEEAIRESEENFRAIAKNANDSIIIVKGKGELAYANERASEVTGYSVDELLKLNMMQLLHPDEIDKVMERFKKRVEGKPDTPKYDTIILRKDGTSVYVEVNAAKTVWKGEPADLAIIRDITERKKVMEELHLKNIVFDSSIAAQSTADINGIIDHVNPAFLELWGYKSNEEAIGSSVGSFFVNEADAVPVLEALTETGEWKGEFLAKRNDGSQFISQGFATAIYNERGEHIGFQSTNLDISERKQAEKALKQSEERIRTLLDSLNTGVMLIDMETHKIVQVNPAALEMIGTHKDKVLNKVCHRFICPSKKGKCPITDDHKTIDQSEHILLTISGQEIPILKTVKPIILNNNKYLLESFVDISERKKAEEKINYQARLVENVSDAIISTDLDFNIISWNKAAELIYGWRSDEVIGKKIKDTITVEYPYDEQETVLKQFFENGFWSGEVIQPSKDGTPINILTSETIFKDITGKRIGVVAINRDITEYKRAEEALRKSEMSLSNAQRIAHIGNWDWDIDNNESYWSDEIYRIFGLKPQEFGANFESFLNSIHPNDREFVKKSVNDALYENKPYNIEHRIVLPDGSERIVREQAEVIFNDTGKAVKMIGIVQDITKRRNVEQEVKFLEQTLHEMNALLEKAPMAILLLHQSGKILRVNEEVINLFKYREEELLNLKIYDLFDSKFKKKVKNHYNKDIFDLLIPNKLEAKIKNKDGKTIKVEITSNILKIADNTIIESFFSDITVRKNSEKRRKLLLDQLIASLEFKSKFFANLTHELRTPLNAILGFSELLLDENYGEMNSEQKDFLTDINSAGSHLLTLINSLLDLTKIEAGKVGLSLEEFELKKIVKEVQSTIKPLYSNKDLTFILEGINNDDFLVADTFRFKQILYNLLSNAIKFTKKGTIKLNGIERSDHWEFQVIDTGIGIDKKDYDVVFREFGRVEDDKIKEISGTGLGLALSKRLVNLHGGDIWFESEVGRGTTFYFTIPKKKQINQKK